jgi:hypothetical protein
MLRYKIFKQNHLWSSIYASQPKTTNENKNLPKESINLFVRIFCTLIICLTKNNEIPDSLSWCCKGEKILI